MFYIYLSRCKYTIFYCDEEIYSLFFAILGMFFNLEVPCFQLFSDFSQL